MRASAASYAMRLLTGVVVALSLVLSTAPAHAAEASPNAPDAGVICLFDATMHRIVPGHPPCGGIGANHAGCVNHAGCLAVTLPGAPPEFRGSGAARWGWPNATHHSGLSILPATPPPRTVA